MQFNSHATNQDLVSEINALCDSDATSYRIEDKTRRVNAGLEELIGLIIGADGTFQYDDTNWTTAPKGSGTLVEGQSAYAFASEYLHIEAIDIKNTSGLWRRIPQIDPRDLNGLSPEEYFGVDSSGVLTKGFPKYYDIVGDSFYLYPSPTSTEVTLTSGFRIWFKRTADLFTTTDTTQEPGLPSPYHILLAYYAAILYCVLYKKERVAWLEKKWSEGKASILSFYAMRRDKDKPSRMTPKIENMK